MANNSHPIFYFPFHSFIDLGTAILHIIVSTNQLQSKHAEGAQKFLGLYSGKIIWLFQLNNALIHMFPTFRTKHEKRVHLGQG